MNKLLTLFFLILYPISSIAQTDVGAFGLSGGVAVVEPQQRPPVSVRYDFDRPLGPEWVFLQDHDPQCYWVHNGKLRLTGSIYDLKTNDRPTFVGLRQEATAFTFDTKIDYYDLFDGDEAGLCVYQAPDTYAQACLMNAGGNYNLRVNLNQKNGNTILFTKLMGPVSFLWLRIQGDSRAYIFYYSTDGQTYREMGRVDCSLLSTESRGGMADVTLGLYAFNGSTRYQAGQSFAEFDYVAYEEIRQ